MSQSSSRVYYGLAQWSSSQNYQIAFRGLIPALVCATTIFILTQ